jgi:hypothetical protein
VISKFQGAKSLRNLVKLMVLACATVGVVVLGAAGPAQASTSKCAQSALRSDHPDVVVVTCAEAGAIRRGTSTIVNNSAQPILVDSLKSLISSPSSAITDCGTRVVNPHTQFSCASPSVPSQPGIAEGATVSTLAQARDTQGQLLNGVFTVAMVLRCGQQALRSDHPDVVVITCGEADGSLRRADSTVVNNSPQPIQVTSLQSLISSPEYGTTDCHSKVINPGAEVSCTSPWVQTRPGTTDFASVFTLIQAEDALGQFISGTFSFVASF